MPIINADNLLKPLAGESPCGENLRYKFSELERLAEGKPEDPFTNTPAEEPNWREVADKAKEFFTRGKHLSISVILTTAAVRIEGYLGLRDGMKLIHGLLRDYWDPLFPQLDVEDNNDPTERINSLAAIASPLGAGGPLKFLDRVLEAPLCDSRQLGRFSLWDIRYAGGQIVLPEAMAATKPARGIGEIDGAFIETDKEKLEEILTAIRESIASVQGIEQIFNEKLGSGKGPELHGLLEVLKDAALQIERRTGQADATAGDAGGATGAGGGGGGGGGGPSLSGEVRNREDVRVALEKVVRYFESNEPSSPVPLIVKGAVLMIGKPFLDIVKVLNPDAVRVLEQIGTPPEAGT